jgi:hypothetical protein
VVRACRRPGWPARPARDPPPLGFVPILPDQRRRGLHDMLAGTVAVEALEISAGIRR